MYNNPIMYGYSPFGIAAKKGIFSSLKSINWSNLLTNTGKTLGIINQTIPIIYQVKPIINNAKTMLRIANTIKESDPVIEKENNTNYIEDTNKPVFYI